MNLRQIICSIVLLRAASTSARLAVTVAPVKVVGQKAIVQLKITNDLGEAVQSARAMCFILDGQRKMVGQSTKWVIGKNGLDAAFGER